MNIFSGEFSCCGGYDYADWKHTVIGGARNSVPDSCCIDETPRCGQSVFDYTDLRVIIRKIHTHGCLTTMMRRLETHVTVRATKHIQGAQYKSHNTF
jgi:hypothetical protein